MKHEINAHRGIIPLIPLVIIGVVLLLGGGGFAGYHAYQSRKAALAGEEQVRLEQNNADKERLIALDAKIKELETQQKATSTAEQSATKIGNIQKEIETLKAENRNLQEKVVVKKTAPEVIVEKPSPPVVLPPTNNSTTALSSSQLIESVKPGVVAIDSRVGLGSGFLVDKKYVVTNAHVVGGAFKVNIRTSDGTVVTGYLAGRDEDNDVALISIPETAGTKVLAFGSSDATVLKQGDPVFALGFPFGLKGDVSFKDGILSRRLTFKEKNYLEISNSILPGNSGGPLVNGAGAVVGINTGGISEVQSSDGTPIGESIKLAIPGKEARNFVTILMGKAGPLSTERKRQIDDYEKFMIELHESIGDYNTVIDEYYSIMDKSAPSTVMLGLLVNTHLNTVQGRIVTLKGNIPGLGFSRNLSDALYSFERLMADMQDIMLHQAKDYAAAKNSRSPMEGDLKKALESRIAANQQKVDEFNSFLDVVNDLAKSQLSYF